MIQSRRFLVFLALALVVAIVASAVVVWLRGGQRGALPASSPVSGASEASPLPTPVLAVAESPGSPARSIAVALLWVVLGVFLALGIAFFTLRRRRRNV